MRLWWESRSERERWLVGLMLVLAAILLLWLWSFARSRTRSMRQRCATAMQRPLLPRRAHERSRWRHPRRRRRDRSDAIAARTAAAAGFPGARIAGQGPGRASVSLDAARPQALFGWIAQMEQAGLVVERLRAQANPDHTLSAEMILGARR